MYASVVIGAGVGMLVQGLDFSFAAAVVACIVATGAIELTNALRYRRVNQQARRWVPLSPRRELITGALATAFIVFVSFLQIPSRASVVEKQLAQSASSPINAHTIQEARVAIESARNARLRIDPALVQRAGDRFVKAAGQTPDAWNTALVFLDYQSFLNAFLPTVPTGLTVIPPGHYEWEIEAVAAENGKEGMSLSWDSDHMVPKADAATLELLSDHLNAGKKFGPLYMMLTKVPIKLDGMRIKNVIFKDSKIAYDGGPIQMQNAYFVNCTFVMPLAPNVQNLAVAVLSSTPAVSFTAG